jgi:octaprenyl-diphosphate synthase
MSSSIQQIQKPIAEELKEFEVRFRESMKSKVALLDTIMTYIVKRKGKQLRPMLVLLSARMYGPISDRTYRGASLVELLHTATLVHDDVVDDAGLRRGFFSINALWKNKVAVLVGDYLLSKGLLLSLRNSDHDLLDILSTAVEEMSEGELLQMEKARKLDITEDVYYDIIQKKTASLIASCCSIGAASAGADSEELEKVRRFGLNLGLAFQIKDDLFDYGQTEDIGKPTGIDIKERKMTLPLIYTLQNVSPATRRKVKTIIKRHNTNKKKVQEVIQIVRDSGGIDYTRAKMNEFLELAKAELNALSASNQEDMGRLVDFVIQRKK